MLRLVESSFDDLLYAYAVNFRGKNVQSNMDLHVELLWRAGQILLLLKSEMTKARSRERSPLELTWNDFPPELNLNVNRFTECVFVLPILKFSANIVIKTMSELWKRYKHLSFMNRKHRGSADSSIRIPSRATLTCTADCFKMLSKPFR